ncbi:lactate utilization protein [Lutispora saccharofermentans]|uniref:Lactate utilization protein n=1 Tax=Lutispora saccharofermentans TaxID=3024236 RepID=A0ABT1NIW4_9FIRM|nr:lactate utilization protein [Lutispora saccharofermentans]MCQ1531009.1 lactate utilization protein [Lutispora saccharofermentans]
MDKRIEDTIKALNKNNFKARFFEDSDTAVKTLLEDIKETDSIGIGGSMTITELGLPKLLIERGNKVFFHWLETTPESMDNARVNASRADVYLTSTNAFTERGHLVNIDGVGNRVTSMIFGPKKVYIICGINKLTENLDKAIERIKENAYKNARRLNLKTPCAITGKCNDCDSPQRMCSVTTILEKKPSKIDIEIIIINKSLGY